MVIRSSEPEYTWSKENKRHLKPSKLELIWKLFFLGTYILVVTPHNICKMDSLWFFFGVGEILINLVHSFSNGEWSRRR